MKMSIFLQGKPPTFAEHIECARFAVNDEFAEMILHARLHNATVLVGLKHGQAVIKRHEESDASLRFEDFFDNAISLSDYRQMENQHVRKREDLAPHLYELGLMLAPRVQISLTLRIKAKKQHDVPAMIRRLVKEDIEFQTELYGKFAIAMMENAHGIIEILGPIQIMNEAPDDAPEWEFLPPES